jgi:hypothetical protein
MDSLPVCSCKLRVDIIKSGCRMSLLVEYWSTLDIVQYHIKIMGLIWKATIVKEEVRPLLAAIFLCNADGLSGWWDGDHFRGK